jgi:hypothetical protein
VTDTPKDWPLEVRRNDDGSLDEVVCSQAFVHLEQMSDNHWWMVVERDGKQVTVNFSSRSKITARVE